MTTNDRGITDNPNETLYIRVFQHPHTFIKSQPGQSTAPGNETIQLEEQTILPLDRILMNGLDRGNRFALEPIADYKGNHKIVSTYPLPSRDGKKTWFVFSKHVQVNFPEDTAKLAQMIMPRSLDGVYLKQGTGDKDAMGVDNLFHLHAGKGLYVDVVSRDEADHYVVKLAQPLNGKITWYVHKDDIERWLEWQGPVLVWDNIPR